MERSAKRRQATRPSSSAEALDEALRPTRCFYERAGDGTGKIDRP